MPHSKIASKIVQLLLNQKKYKNSKLKLEELVAKFPEQNRSEVEPEIRTQSEIFKINEQGEIELLKKFASRSMGLPYACRQAWTMDTFVQCGDQGVVGTNDPERPVYTTAFFEAFPLDSFIRGEGESVEMAELKAWAEYQRISQCDPHEFERRGRTDDYGYCKKCNYFASGVFEILTKCAVCNLTVKGHSVTRDSVINYYCDDHYYELSWTKDLEPFVAKSISRIYGSLFKNEQAVRVWLKQHNKTLEKTQIDFFCRIYGNIDSVRVIDELRNPLLEEIYNLVVSNPGTVNPGDVWINFLARRNGNWNVP